MGRRKTGAAIDGAMKLELAVDESFEAASVPVPDFPGSSLVRSRQRARAEEFVDKLEEKRAPEAEGIGGQEVARSKGREQLIRILTWYSLPFQWRVPSTEIELANEMNVSLHLVRRAHMMYKDGVDLLFDENRKAMAEYAKLRSMDVIVGVCETAKTSPQMLDKFMKIAWGEDLAQPLIAVQTNVGFTLEEMVEKEQKRKLPSWLEGQLIDVPANGNGANGHG